MDPPIGGQPRRSPSALSLLAKRHHGRLPSPRSEHATRRRTIPGQSAGRSGGFAGRATCGRTPGKGDGLGVEIRTRVPEMTLVPAYRCSVGSSSNRSTIRLIALSPASTIWVGSSACCGRVFLPSSYMVAVTDALGSRRTLGGLAPDQLATGVAAVNRKPFNVWKEN